MAVEDFKWESQLWQYKYEKLALQVSSSLNRSQAEEEMETKGGSIIKWLIMCLFVNNLAEPSSSQIHHGT